MAGGWFDYTVSCLFIRPVTFWGGNFLIKAPGDRISECIGKLMPLD